MPRFVRRGGNPDGNHGDIQAEAERLGVQVVSTTGVGFNFPDQVWGFEGLTILVEVTNPNVKPSKATRERKERQAGFRRWWRGGLCVEIRTPADVVDLITNIKANAAGQWERIIEGKRSDG